MAIVSAGAMLPNKQNNMSGNMPAIGPSTPLYGDPSTFGAASNRQTGDYNNIMSANANLLTPSADINNSISNLGSLALTGGYSPADMTDIRARAASPIRSIYATAQQNLDRSRELSGGTMPNYAAATAKMARDLSSQLNTNLADTNADIAQNVVRNRLSAASPYASAASGELERQGSVLNNMRGLYGTTPALTDMFGRQVASAAGLGQNQQQINNQRDANILNIGSRFFS